MRIDARAPGGFTLVAVLLTLVGLGFLAVAGFIVAMSEVRITRQATAALHAFYAADSGLGTVVGTTLGYPAAHTVLAGRSDTTTVTATPLVQMAGGRRLYLVRSRARYRSSDGSIGERILSLVLVADPDSLMRRPAVKRGTWRDDP